MERFRAYRTWIYKWSLRGLPMRPLKNTLIGEEWMALRQIASGAKAAAIPRSVRTRLEVLDLIARDDYGQLMLTENGRQLIATVNKLDRQ